jgi:hypothetical protein
LLVTGALDDSPVEDDRMASSGKPKTTMAKLRREAALRERRLDKAARKQARKMGLLDPRRPDPDAPGLDGELDTDAPALDGELDSEAPTLEGEPDSEAPDLDGGLVPEAPGLQAGESAPASEPSAGL